MIWSLHCSWAGGKGNHWWGETIKSFQGREIAEMTMMIMMDYESSIAWKVMMITGKEKENPQKQNSPDWQS